MALSVEESEAEVIANLYRSAKLRPPSEQHPITPLGSLIGDLNLICREIPGLTSEGAMQVLTPYGVKVLVTCNEEPLAGYLYANNRFGALFVRRDDPVVRRRFSVAHELGHYLLHFRPLLLKVDEEGAPLLNEINDSISGSQTEGELGKVPPVSICDLNDQLPPYIQREREANSFAANLLMPGDLVRALTARYGTGCKDEDLVWRLASDLLVSHEAMRWRLRALSLLSSRAGDVA